MCFSQTSLFFFYSYRGFGTLPRSRFLDVMQRSLGERCVTSQKRLRGRLGIWLLSVFSGTAIERWLKNPLKSPFGTRVPGSDKTVLQSSASSSQLRSREIFWYASPVACRLIEVTQRFSIGRSYCVTTQRTACRVFRLFNKNICDH